MGDVVPVQGPENQELRSPRAGQARRMARLRQRENSLFLCLSVLCRPSTSWMRPTRFGEDHLPSAQLIQMLILSGTASQKPRNNTLPAWPSLSPAKLTQINHLSSTGWDPSGLWEQPLGTPSLVYARDGGCPPPLESSHILAGPWGSRE